MEDDLDDWFAREILVHEAALMRYLLRWWPHRDDAADLRQDVYVRVYEAAAVARPQHPKSLLFTSARNLMTDRWRRSRVVPLEALGEVDALHVLTDEVTPDRRLAAQRELRALVRAFDRLPAKRREVLWLRRVEELPVREIAERMGISPKTAENHLALATRAIADMVLGGSDVPLLPLRQEYAYGEHYGD
ncbi:RNA polymerase sigma factor [Luteimonas sp. SDU82]|uniref:RNA polymerase sigma factor n=1 Tax=Luteimonas sp. SDU82 TaxID=3422592 RepID=UPI003EBA82F6